jgi:hypothetical protein
MCNHGSNPSDVLLNLSNNSYYYYYYYCGPYLTSISMSSWNYIFFKGEKLYLKFSFDI